jgi:hypothetical protein
MWLEKEIYKVPFPDAKCAYSYNTRVTVRRKETAFHLLSEVWPVFKNKNKKLPLLGPKSKFSSNNWARQWSPPSKDPTKGLCLVWSYPTPWRVTEHQSRVDATTWQWAMPRKQPTPSLCTTGHTGRGPKICRHGTEWTKRLCNSLIMHNSQDGTWRHEPTNVSIACSVNSHSK